MKTWKRIARVDAVRRVLSGLIAAYVGLVYRSSRWRVVGGETPRALWDTREPFILGFWHARGLMMPPSWKQGVPIRMLVSSHADGQLMARTVAHFGIGSVAGSTTRGGTLGLRRLIAALGAGECVGITPDGPRGPRMRASEGVVVVARLSGRAIVPAAYSTERGRLLPSWDRFLLPWPFGRGVLVWGEPIRVPRDADADAREVLRLCVEEALNAVSREADRLCRRTPVEPAPARERPGA